MGADIATVTSTSTQLSANWDASTDPESGISGYQYAIGTTAGGTDITTWTSLGNVTTVTQTGLTLVLGQTYFFSVQAVNGAGLTGSAANSDGQTVVDITPPTVTSSLVNGANGAVLNGTDNVSTQRSMVKSLVVSFNEVVTLNANAFTIVNRGTSASITAAVATDNSSGHTVATLTWAGTVAGQTSYDSLIDGNYQLTVDATKVHNSSSGVNMASNYTLGTVKGDNFYRFFGDMKSAWKVDGTCFSYFALTMNKAYGNAAYLWYFDCNGTGATGSKVDGTDFAYFSANMSKSLTFH